MSGLAAASCGVAIPAWAQAGASDQIQSSTDDAGMIVVTAQRRSELSRDVPITITTADAAELKQANIESLVGLPKITPGVRLDQQGAYTQPTIRGIGTTLVQTGAGSSVGVYVNGFYLPNSLSLDFDFLNVKNIQVLKGPQGTLFGRNSTGGAILVQTAEPSAETAGSIEAQYERFNAAKIQAYATTGLTRSLALSVEGSYSRGDGFQKDNLYDGSLADGGGYAQGGKIHHPGAYEDWAVRTALKAYVSDSASLTFRYEHIDKNDPTGVVDGTYSVAGQVYSAGDTIPGTVFALQRGQTASNARQYFRFKADTVQLTANIDLGFADLTSYTQYRKETEQQFLEGDYSSAAVLALSLPERDRIMSQELLINSKPGGRLQYTGGIFLFEQKIKADVLLAFGSPAFFQFSATGAKTRTYAAFADATYQLLDDVFLTGGLRYSHDEVVDPFYQTTPGVADVFTFQSNRKDDSLSPRVVLRYKPTPQTSLYASWTRGYKAAIPDYRSSSGSEYLKPEKIDAFEVGAKYGDRALTAELAGFYYDYKNLQNGYYVQGNTILSNAASSRIKGIEANLKYDFGNGFELSAAGTYLDAKYRKYLNAGYFAPTFIADNDGDGRPEFAGFDTSSTHDASGNQVVRAPKLSGTVAARYTTDLANGKLSGSVNLYHTSTIFFDPANQFGQKAYDILSARVQWKDPTEHYTIAVFGDNLTNSTYLTQVNVGATAAGTIWGRPATYGISLRYDFGGS
jgi:iron complex outermembrane receptor protein